MKEPVLLPETKGRKLGENAAVGLRTPGARRTTPTVLGLRLAGGRGSVAEEPHGPTILAPHRSWDVSDA
jgi:hypothetical protein